MPRSVRNFLQIYWRRHLFFFFSLPSARALETGTDLGEHIIQVIHWIETNQLKIGNKHIISTFGSGFVDEQRALIFFFIPPFLFFAISIVHHRFCHFQYIYFKQCHSRC